METQEFTPAQPSPGRNGGNLGILRLSGSGAFALVLIMFFFTFCFVKCNETRMVRFSGIDLAFGLQGKPSKEMKSLEDRGNKGTSGDPFGSGSSSESSAESSSPQDSSLKQKGYRFYNAMALLALLLSVGALVVSLLPSHKSAILAFVMGLGVVLALLLVKVFFDRSLEKPGSGDSSGLADRIRITSEFTFFYWFAVLLAIAGAVTGLIRFLQGKKTEAPPA